MIQASTKSSGREKLKSFRSRLFEIDRLVDNLPREGSSDATQDLLLHLGRAYQAYLRIQDDTEFEGRSLIGPAIRRAFRETLYVRSNLPVESLDTRRFSRFGRYLTE